MNNMRTESALIFRLTVKSINPFMKSNRQYLKNQQTVLSSPDSPCQTFKIPQNPCQTVMNFFWLFIHPCRSQLTSSKVQWRTSCGSARLKKESLQRRRELWFLQVLRLLNLFPAIETAPIGTEGKTLEPDCIE